MSADTIPVLLEAVKYGSVEDVKTAIDKIGVEAFNIIKNVDQTKETLLHTACMYNIKHPDVAFYLIDTYELHINIHGFSNATPLMYACRSGQIKVVKRFFETKSQFENIDSNYFGLLHYCFMGGQGWSRQMLLDLGYTSAEEEEEMKIKIAEILFSKNPEEQYPFLLGDYRFEDAKKNLRHQLGHHDNYYRTVIDLLILNQYEKALPFIISKGAKFIWDPTYMINDSNKQNTSEANNIRTFVHWCVETRKDNDYFNCLLGKFPGNAVNLQDWEGYTPLHYAVDGNQRIYSGERFRIGYNISGDELAKWETKYNQERLRITELLLDNQADVNVKDNKRETPLHSLVNYHGCRQNDISVIQLLIKNAGKVFDEHHQECMGIIHSFVCKMHLHTIITQRPEINVENVKSCEGLYQDQKEAKPFKDTMKICIDDIGIDVNDRSENGRTPLHYCCLPCSKVPGQGVRYYYHAHLIIKVLVEDFNADVNAQDETGYTALMYAVKYEMIHQTAMLMKYGADSHIEGNDGMNAFRLAYECGDKTQLFLNTLRNIGSTFGEENNLIVQCYTNLSQVHRLLSTQEDTLNITKKEHVMNCLKEAEESLIQVTKDPEVNRKLKIQQDVLKDNRAKICEIISPEYVYDGLRQDGVLTEHTQNKIESEKTRLHRNQALLDIIQRQGISALPSFIEALRGPIAGYGGLAEELCQDYKSRLGNVSNITHL